MADHARVGDAAPDFTLTGWYDGEARKFTLSAERGHPVLLAFHPSDDGPVSGQQLTAYSDELAALTGNGARVWAISPDGLEAKAALAGVRGIKLPLLSDPVLAVARAYGAADGESMRRAVIIVDAAGRVAWSHISLGGLRYRSPAELTAALAAL